MQLLLCALLTTWPGSAARAADRTWTLAGALGGDAALAPTPLGYGFLLLDASHPGPAGGRYHLLYNTDTVQVGLEQARLAGGRLEAALALRGEAVYAGVLPNYFQRGRRIAGRGFGASYLQALPSLKWHLLASHSLELTLGLRQWFFSRLEGPLGSTDDDLLLPPDTFVVEPRLTYTYWRIRGDDRELAPHTLLPRLLGLALQVTLGLDLRADARAWGADVGAGTRDPRNDPGATILMARQRLMGGLRVGGPGRIQLEQHGSWGRGEDDLTRNRAGGMTPYVVPVPGLPWAAILSERLLAGQLSGHVALDRRRQHELGVALAGGAFNDIERVGEIDRFGAAVGAAMLADLRLEQVQLHGRLGYLLPSTWARNEPHLSLLLAAGVQLD